METSQAVTGALYAALGVQAEGSGTMNNVTFGNDRVQYYETVASGSGAGDGFDGADAVQTHMTNSRLTDPEVLEWRYPVRVESFAVRDGSGGAGRWHGGCGVERRLRFLEPDDGRRCSPATAASRRTAWRAANRARWAPTHRTRRRHGRHPAGGLRHGRRGARATCWSCAHRAAEVTGPGSAATRRHRNRNDRRGVADRPCVRSRPTSGATGRFCAVSTVVSART